MDIRREEIRQGNEVLFQPINGIRLQKFMPTFRNHDRIDDQFRDSVLLHLSTHESGGRGGREHSGFYSGHIKVIEDGVDLCLNDGVGKVVYGGDFLCVLGGN